MRYDAAIFDLDGTLLNTLEDLADSTNYALNTCGYPSRTVEEICRFVGNGVTQLIHLAVPQGTAPEKEAQCLTFFRAHYLTNMHHKTAPYPGISPLLDYLHARDCKIAVVSNKFDQAVKTLCTDYFADQITVAIGESASVRKKPAPDTVLRALQVLGTTIERAVYIGDSDVDIETARNAGMDCISVSWGFRDVAFLRAHGATQIVDTPTDLALLLTQ